jgi:DNA repair ATPase RecN
MSIGLEALEQVKQSYGEWKYIYDKITHLTELEKRMNNQNERELLGFYTAEVVNFGIKLKKLLADIMYVTEDLAISLEPSESVQVDSTKDTTGVYNKNIKNLLKLLADYGVDKKGRGDASEKGAAKGMLILQEADFIYSGFYKAVKVPFGDGSRTSVTASGGNSKSPRVAAPANDNIIDTTKANLESYSEKILSLQLYIKSIGFDGTSILNQMDGIQEDLSGAISAIKSAQSKLASVRNSLPDIEPLLSRINLLKSEWDGLLRKHNVNNPNDFDALVAKWNTDIASMATISEELPLLRRQILDKRVAYVKTSRQLSHHRRAAVTVLSSQLNNILPNLEMSTKKVDIELVISKEVEDYLDEEVQAINDGTKSIKPTGTICSDKGWDHVVMKISSSFISDSDVASPYSSVNTDGDGVVDKSLKPNTLSLSSGEMARLSLALETCVLINSDANNNSDPVGTIIFDEIDAHVGGDAAIAIAKLLKSQGKKRQVIAVTHNPVFAAAADKHFVVKKLSTTSSNALIDSTLYELSGDDREAEIMRMTSGSINTTAGKEWAKTLLTLDFSSF